MSLDGWEASKAFTEVELQEYKPASPCAQRERRPTATATEPGTVSLLPVACLWLCYSGLTSRGFTLWVDSKVKSVKHPHFSSLQFVFSLFNPKVEFGFPPVALFPVGFCPPSTLVEFVFNFLLSSLPVAAFVLSKNQPVPLVSINTVEDRGIFPASLQVLL